MYAPVSSGTPQGFRIVLGYLDVVLRELRRMPGLPTSLFKTATQKCCLFRVVWCFFPGHLLFFGNLNKNTQDFKKRRFFCQKNEKNMYLSKNFCLPFQKEMDMAWKCGWWWMQVCKKFQVLQVLEAFWRLVTIEDVSGKKNCFARLL